MLIEDGVLIEKRVLIEDGVLIEKRVLIEDGVLIEDRVSIKGRVLSKDRALFEDGRLFKVAARLYGARLCPRPRLCTRAWVWLAANGWRVARAGP